MVGCACTFSPYDVSSLGRLLASRRQFSSRMEPPGQVAKQGRPVKKAKKNKPLLEPLKEDNVEQNGQSKFARALGSVDYMTREKGVQALTRWMQCKADIPEEDMIKLWKGLYFCFWHSDKVPVQVRRSSLLAARTCLQRLVPSLASCSIKKCEARSSCFLRPPAAPGCLSAD